MCAAFRTDQFLAGGDRQRGSQIVPVWTAVFCQPGIHQAQTVQKFRARAEGTPDTGNAGALVQRQSRRHVQDLVYLRFGRLCHAPPGISRKRVQISA